MPISSSSRNTIGFSSLVSPNIILVLRSLVYSLTSESDMLIFINRPTGTSRYAKGSLGGEFTVNIWARGLPLGQVENVRGITAGSKCNICLQVY